MAKKTDKPETVKLTHDEFINLTKRIQNSDLSSEDSSLIIKSLGFMIWLQGKLSHAKITIHKLKKLFDIGGDKKSKKKRDDEQKTDLECEESIPSEENTKNSDHTNSTQAPAKRQRGRIPADAYTSAETVVIMQPTLAPGEPCPEECGGKLYDTKLPSVVIRVLGVGLGHVKRYELQKLRCALCGKLYTASLPNDVCQDKYDHRFKAVLAMCRYYVGMPFFGIEQFQRVLGQPLPDSTQWDLIRDVADSAEPVMHVLEYNAAQSELTYYDDTRLRILSHHQSVKNDPNAKRKGCFTTALTGSYDNHTIQLYYSSPQHAGENISSLLSKRQKKLPPIKTMCDALAANVSHKFKVILCHCLAHGLRKFTEIEDYFPDECKVVIDALAKVYEYDQFTKDEKMNPDDRLVYHKKHSKPVLDDLFNWMNQQFDHHLVEPNSHLGRAFKYLLRHWKALTQFLRVVGAPLDNNIAEAALKIPIRSRKRSMFYKTENGARVGSMLLSVMTTAIKNDVNPIDYLVALQVNKSKVKFEPDKWLPWNYQDNLDFKESQKAAVAS